MPLDWLNTPLDADIGDLIARKKRAKTIELLRSQLQGRMVPPVQMRLQLADLLVQAGREAEAIPVLIGLADEFSGDGFVAKAIAILKRVDKVQPGRPDVESRLASLVKQQRAAPASSSHVGRTRPPEFGMEEIREEAASAPVTEPGPSPEPPAAALPDSGVLVEPPPLPVATAAPPPAAETDTTRRVRGVFRRFLSSLPGTGSGPEPAATLPPAVVSVPVPAATAPPAPSAAFAPPAAEAVPSEDTNPDVQTLASSGETVPDADAQPAAVTAPQPAVADEPDTTEDSDTTVVGADAIEMDESTDAAEGADDAAAAAPTADVAPEVPGPASPEVTPSVAPAEAGVAGRIRGALRWLVSSLGTAEQGGDAPAESPAEAGATSAAAPVSGEPVASRKDAAQTADVPAAAAGAGDETGDEEPMSDEVFQERLLDLAQDLLRRPGAEGAPRDAPPLDRGLVLRYAQRLLATSLFGDLSEEELLAVVRGLRLHLHGPGDIMVTEGERGQSVFVLASGSAKVFVRSPSGRNFPVAELREGEFFGEISSLSGRPRSATVTASARCELLELDRPTMDEIARVHPRVADVLEESYIRRASSPEAAAVRAVPMNDAGAERKAIEILEAHFGQSRWDPRMRLRLADVLLKAGKFEDAVPVLIGLADDLARAGYPDKAIAVLKKIEKIRRRDIEVVNLAPLGGGAAPPARTPSPRGARAAPAARIAAKTDWSPQPTAEFFQGWLVDVLRDRVKRSETEGEREGPRAEGERSGLGSIRGYGPGLSASPLFEDFDDDELLAVIRGLRLLSFEAGDIIITEGEPGQSLFVLTTGTVKVFVRDPAGRNVALVPLGEGAFFGEIATLSGRPRSATVTAGARCELLELDKAALEAILKVHPRVRDVLEEHYIARANDPEAAAIRGTSRRADDGTS
jgi:CRP-like cAMP-binding protein